MGIGDWIIVALLLAGLTFMNYKIAKAKNLSTPAVVTLSIIVWPIVFLYVLAMPVKPSQKQQP